MEHTPLEYELYRLGALAGNTGTIENDNAFLDYIISNMESFDFKCWSIFIYFIKDRFSYIKYNSAKVRLIINEIDESGFKFRYDSYSVICWIKAHV